MLFLWITAPLAQTNWMYVWTERKVDGWKDGWIWRLLITYKFKCKPNGENLLPVTPILGFWLGLILGAKKSSNIQAAVSLVVQHFYRGSNIFTGTSASAWPYTCFCTGMLTACWHLAFIQGLVQELWYNLLTPCCASACLSHKPKRWHKLDQPDRHHSRVIIVFMNNIILNLWLK